MTKKIINVGVDPGGQGDGDSLRDAFIKAQANFDELYSVIPVTDTSLDHDNPNIDGTIAKALADTGAAGGGTVLVGPGVFKCPSLPLTIVDNVILKGVGRRATTIEITGTQSGILLNGQFGAIESLQLIMPNGATSDGIIVNASDIHIRDIALSGSGPNAWGINVDGANVTSLTNIRMGGFNNPFRGNGIIYQNSKNRPVNIGDAQISKVDILLLSESTTGIKLQGSDTNTAPDPIINNILLSQVDVIGTGAQGTCVGVHLHNAQRIVLSSVDLENLGTAIIEEGSNIRPTTNNVYMAVFAFGVGASYVSDGRARRRLFFGCDNITPESTSDGDVVVPDAIWLNNGSSRIWESASGLFQIDNGDSNLGLQISVNTSSPEIRQSSTSQDAALVLGRSGSKGVKCVPGIVLAELGSPISNPEEGTLAQFSAGVVGPNAGLYQMRAGVWVFIN